MYYFFLSCRKLRQAKMSPFSVFGKSFVLLVLWCVCVVRAQEMDCYGPGSIAGAVLGTFFVTLILLVGGYCGYRWFWKNRRGKFHPLDTFKKKIKKLLIEIDYTFNSY